MLRIKNNLKKLFKNNNFIWKRQFIKSKKSKNITIKNLKKTQEYFYEGVIPYKSYARFDEIILPPPSLSSKKTLCSSLEKRISSRDFNQKKISTAQISNLLYYSFGINESKSGFTHKFAPSAGARYPLEAYVIPVHADLNEGLYHYYPKNHSLEKLLEKKIDIPKYFMTDSFPWILNGSLFIIITAVFMRTMSKYGDRGYNYIYTEVGHVGQNISLVATALNLKISPLGGYYEDDINELIDIGEETESVIYTLVIG